MSGAASGGGGIQETSQSDEGWVRDAEDASGSAGPLESARPEEPGSERGGGTNSAAIRCDGCLDFGGMIRRHGRLPLPIGMVPQPRSRSHNQRGPVTQAPVGTPARESRSALSCCGRAIPLNLGGQVRDVKLCRNDVR